MKRKLLSLLLGTAMVATMLTACGTKEKETPKAGGAPDVTATTAPTVEASASATPTEAPATDPTASGYELALVTDLGTIDDKSFNQGAWEGLKQYADEKGITYKYYQPQEGTTDSYIETIGLAIEGGAKLVVCPGFLFEEPIFVVQDQYPEVTFILLDGEPHNGDYSEFKTNANVLPIFFQEDQVGYLAGYAAVKDGYTKLGFMGGMAVPAVVRYGYGFVQGAEAAALELGITDIDVKYHYTGNFDASPEAKAMAASWYESGTEVIFGCGGSVGNSVMAAAEELDKKVIGVDVDQSSESPTVITSAMKKLSLSIYEGVASFYAGTFKGGAKIVLTAANDGIALPMATSKFNTFTQADYDAVFAKLQANEITIYNEVSDTTTADITLTVATVDYVE
jgi:basic membrane protein A